MTYQTAYKLLVAAYKSAKGVMPQGIDMLKLKMKARQKVIDAKKVIEFPKDKITNPFKPRPTKTEIMMKQEGIPVTIKGKTTTMTPDGILKMLMGKGKGKDVKIGQAPKTTKRKPAVDPKLTQEENIKRIMAENKAAAKRLQEKMNKPEKTLGEKLKDYKGDPDAMKDGGKVKKKRKHNDNVDDEDIGEGKSKERFLRVMPEVEDIPRSDGIMELATGGMTNIGDTYDNNPTLQSQYPNKQDYLDMFAQQTTTTPQYATAYQSTGSTDPINPNIKQIKPIIPISDGGDGGGGGGPPPGGGINFDYGYTSPGGNLDADGNFNNIDDIGEGTVADEDYTLGMRARDAYSGIKQAITYNPLNPMFKFNVAKATLSKGKEKALDIIQAIKDKKAAAKALAAANTGYTNRGTKIDFGDYYNSDGSANTNSSMSHSNSVGPTSSVTGGKARAAKGGLIKYKNGSFSNYS